jgi:hypothetical protein
MENVSILIIILFVASTVFTVWQLYNASNKSKAVLAVAVVLMLLQAVLGIVGFYQQNMTFPPRFSLLIGPPLLIIILLFVTKPGREFLDLFSIQKLTLLHTVRIPVEITLYFLFTASLVPELMTFEGRNLDIVSGLTAPIVFFLYFVGKKINKTVFVAWNFLCLGLLANIVAIALFSLQTPFQKLAFEQPNVGVTLFPFVWLPGIIVPAVLFSHLVSIRQLTTTTRPKKQG